MALVACLIIGLVGGSDMPYHKIGRWVGYDGAKINNYNY